MVFFGTFLRAILPNMLGFPTISPHVTMADILLPAIVVTFVDTVTRSALADLVLFLLSCLSSVIELLPPPVDESIFAIQPLLSGLSLFGEPQIQPSAF